jgi:hypothetical protein
MEGCVVVDDEEGMSLAKRPLDKAPYLGAPTHTGEEVDGSMAALGAPTHTHEGVDGRQDSVDGRVRHRVSRIGWFLYGMKTGEEPVGTRSGTMQVSSRKRMMSPAHMLPPWHRPQPPQLLAMAPVAFSTTQRPGISISSLGRHSSIFLILMRIFFLRFISARQLPLTCFFLSFNLVTTSSLQEPRDPLLTLAYSSGQLIDFNFQPYLNCFICV